MHQLIWRAYEYEYYAAYGSLIRYTKDLSPISFLLFIFSFYHTHLMIHSFFRYGHMLGGLLFWSPRVLIPLLVVGLEISVELGSKAWEIFRLFHGSNQVLIKWVGSLVGSTPLLTVIRMIPSKTGI